jgi:hypothetical protein
MADPRTSDILERIQRIEAEQAALRAQIEGERQLRFLATHIVGAAQTTQIIGTAIDNFAQAMRAAQPRGRTGGLARNRNAWRYFDGTFMPEAAKNEAYEIERERYAAGGRARAAKALRADHGTFLAVARETN